MRLPRLLLWLIPIGAVIAPASYLGSRPKSVRVIHPEIKVIAETIAASGEVRGQTETNVGAQTGGRVATTLVRAGDRVRLGQIIARIDDSVLRAEVQRAGEALRTAEVGVEQADDAVRSAQAQLAVAARKPLEADVARTRAEAAENVAVSEAKVVAARQRVTELERGQTPEQRRQTTAQVEQSELALQKADRDLDRQKKLFRAGAIAQATLDDAETARDTARKALENLKARQQEIEVGTREEEIAQARADLHTAEATLTGAKATGEAQIRSLLAQPRIEDVQLAQARLTEAQRAREAAQARVGEARIALDVARHQLDQTAVTAPFAGTITEVVTEQGGVTGPNQPIFKLVRTGKPEIRVSVDEDNLNRLRVGQTALVTADAYPGEQVTARVRELGAEVNSGKGQIELKLDPLRRPDWLRPGQTLNVNLIVDSGSPRMTIPVSAVTAAGNVPQVLVVDKGVVRKHQIETGATGPEGVVVKSGLEQSALVVMDSTAAAPGQHVEARLR
jgi:RND family efflux transporter MFP subunit